MSNANQPGAVWAGRRDPFYVVAGHLVSPEDNFGEIGRMENGDLRRPRRITAGVEGFRSELSVIEGFGAPGTLDFQRSNGTREAPTGITFPDLLGVMSFSGFDGVSLGVGAAVRAEARTLWSPTNHGTELQFQTVGISSAVLQTRWRVEPQGSLLTAFDGGVDIGASGAGRPRDIFMTRDLLVGRNLVVEGFGRIEGALQVEGEVILEDALTVQGEATFEGEVLFENPVIFDTTVDFGSPIDIQNNLNHTGAGLGFYANGVIAQQVGVPVTAAGVHAACVALGLFTA